MYVNIYENEKKIKWNEYFDSFVSDVTLFTCYIMTLVCTNRLIYKRNHMIFNIKIVNTKMGICGPLSSRLFVQSDLRAKVSANKLMVPFFFQNNVGL